MPLGDKKKLKNSKKQSFTSKDIVSPEEQKMAEFLKARNLDKTNIISQTVHPKNSFYAKYVKRLLDILIGTIAFIIFLPINIVIGIGTYFDVGRPIFYKQARIGKDGKKFMLIKFRSMNEKKDENGNLLPANERVTKYGKFIRKYSLDELLNFWSIIKGDMSIIGPRPMPDFFEDRMSERHKMRHAVRPGLECPCKIPEGSKLNNYYWKFERDVWYVENISFFTDVKMIMMLFEMTFNFKTRGKHAGGLSYFVGYDDNGYAISMRQAKEDYDMRDII